MPAAETGFGYDRDVSRHPAIAIFSKGRERRWNESVAIECGTLEVAGKSVTLTAEIRKGVITAVRPLACAGCSSRKGKRAVARSTMKELLKTVDIELAKRKTARPDRPVGVSDICIVIDWGDKTCIYCLLAPNACMGGGL